MRGRLIAIVGPSGAGKDTLIDAARSARPDLVVARRVITRPEAAGGEAFDGVSVAEFERRRDAGAFTVWWAAHRLLYGVPATVERDIANGRDVIFNGSRKALPAIRAAHPELAVIMVTAPSPVLAARLAARGRETAAEIEARLSRAADPAPEGAVIVMNDGSVAEGAARLLAALSRLGARG